MRLKVPVRFGSRLRFHFRLSLRFRLRLRFAVVTRPVDDDLTVTQQFECK